MENTNTITISLEDYNEYIILKERLRIVKNKVNASNHVFAEEILEILEIERKATKKESEE